MDNAVEIEIGLIYPNPDQPRKLFDEAKLEELADSIRSYGVLEPIVVTPRGERYMIIAGERRWRASNIAGLEKMPARSIDADDALVEELALLENVQREDLNPVEQAKGYERLLQRGYTVETLAAKLGFKQSWRINERLALLRLVPEIQQLVVNGDLRASEGFHVSRVPASQQVKVLEAIKSGKANTWNKVTRFVDGLLASDDTLFELQTITAEERETILHFEHSLAGIKRFLQRATDEQRIQHLKKVAFHSSINPDDLDAVIVALQKVRLVVLQGKGLKDAREAV
jgi:ParB/RepB/Spo0J family partition protein